MRLSFLSSRWWRRATLGLSLLLLTWVVYRAVAVSDALALAAWGPAEWLAMLTATAIYLAVGASAAAVGYLLFGGRGAGLRVSPVLGAYFVSQIGKYLPGNVAHHIGRVVLLRRQHIPAPTIVAVMTLETIWGIGVALALGCIALLEFGDGILPPGLRPALLPALFCAALAGMAAPWLLRRRFAAWLARLRPEAAQVTLSLPPLPLAMLAVLVYGLGYLAMGYAALHLAPAVTSGGLPGVWRFAELYALAWIAGFLTPGAPAGLGVRDAVLLAGLSPELGPEAAALVLALRLVTTLGDGVIYLIGLPLLARRDAGEARVSPDRGQ